jgi:two-component system response regulator AtoC
MAEKLLIIDDEENMRHMLSVMTSRAGYEVSLAQDGLQGFEAVIKGQFDLILCDLKMPKMDGLAFLQKLQEEKVQAVVIMMSAYGTIDSAVEAMKYGAYDFITKPFKSGEVLLALKKAGEREELRRENKILRQQVKELQSQCGFEAMVVVNKKMLGLINVAKKIAQYDSSVLITGESGTGKELFARGIVQSGPRKDKPFVAVNCGSFPAELLESEFFGYVKGSFTGANSDKKGLFEEANNGTLFLDEIGELPISLQVKFLRVLQEGEIKPVGALQARKINVRIIAATSKNLESAVFDGTFRKDLFYRLNVVAFHLPPLRDRKDEISRLTSFFIDKINRNIGVQITGISSNAMQLLMRHDWPGNVRELENVIERAAILSDGHILEIDNFVATARPAKNSDNLVDILGTLSLKKARKIVEAKLISSALHSVNGNKSKAADILEISYPSLLNKIKEYLEV